MTYTELWRDYKISRGLLDKQIHLGRVHFYQQEGATYYRWEDVCEHLALEVENMLLAEEDD